VTASSVLEVLDLERRGADRFVGMASAVGGQRLYGGLVAAQGLRAAQLTVPAGRVAHSLHAYFLRPGVTGVPIDLDVARHRDGRSFTTRAITASQQGEVICSLMASFQEREDGDDWEAEGPPTATPPEEVRTPHPLADYLDGMVEIVSARDTPPGETAPIHPCWVRIRGELGEDPDVHLAALAFLSDFGILGGGVMPRAAGPNPRFMGASLDHAVWFHRVDRAEGWFHISSRPVTNAGSRGLAHGWLHDRDGTHVASMSQEGLIRLTDGRRRPDR